MKLSLKWKIQLWHAVILGVVLSILGVGFYHYEKAHRLAEIDELLDKRVHTLHRVQVISQGRHPRGRPDGRSPRHGERRRRDRPEGGPERRRDFPPPRPAREPSNIDGWTMREADNKEPRQDSNGPQRRKPPGASNESQMFEEHFVPLGYYAFTAVRNKEEPVFKSSNFPAIEIPENVGSVGNGFYFRFRDDAYREMYHEAPLGPIFVGLDLRDFHQGLSSLKWKITASAFGLFAFGVGVGYFFVARSIRPLKNIETTASKITEGKLSERIPDLPSSGASELQTLASNLNETFSQLEDSFNRQIRFTADASHELRTPLTALLAQIELGLKSTRSSEDYADILKVCKRSSTRIRKITEQLIELSRYDSGRVEMDLEETSLELMLNSLAEELRPYVETEGHQLKTDISDSKFICDPFRLEQVITNLVNNAIQHNSRPITITLRGEIVGDECHLEVVDTGKGIQPRNLEKLFDRFFQESASRTKENGSTNVGLGLSISEAIVKAHGGRIEVSSTPDVETRFCLVIPRTSRKKKHRS